MRFLAGTPAEILGQERDLYTQTLKAFGPTLAHDISLLDGTARNEVETRAAFLALDDLRKYEAQYRVSQYSEVDVALKMMQSAQSDTTLFGVYGSSADMVLRGLRSPWVDHNDIARSVAGMAELSAIGQALQTAQPFDATFTQMLRAELGDWREIDTWPARIFEDPIARLGFYTERGFNSALTDFPTKAFDEALDLSGITHHQPEGQASKPEGPKPDGEPSIDDMLVAPTLNVLVYNYVYALEENIRRLIVTVLEKAAGPKWMRQRLPGGMLDQWNDKKTKREAQGGPVRPLIEYADFTDYVPIISKNDNWTDGFCAIFGRKEFVQEAFYRLYPYRLDTAHTRVLLDADRLYVYVEVRRLLTALQRAGHA